MTPARHVPDMFAACSRDNRDYLCITVDIDRK